jgi:hypothetical protein
MLKLMEVRLDGTASGHFIIEVLLIVNEGMTSKNPKVIQASASLCLDASNQFGATSLPLALYVKTATENVIKYPMLQYVIVVLKYWLKFVVL